MKRLFFCICAAILFLACDKAQEEITVESVSLSQPSAEMFVGESLQLEATVLPADAVNKTISWSSSNKTVAMVEDGTVTGVGEGEAAITAKAGDKEATCIVTVKKAVVSVESVSLDKTELSLQVGASETLTAKVLPDDATDMTVTWSTSNAAVATVENGTVTGVGEGEATITAKAGDKEATW